MTLIGHSPFKYLLILYIAIQLYYILWLDYNKISIHDKLCVEYYPGCKHYIRTCMYTCKLESQKINKLGLVKPRFRVLLKK